MRMVSWSSPLLHFFPSVLGLCGPVFQNTSPVLSSQKGFLSLSLCLLHIACTAILFISTFLCFYIHIYITSLPSFILMCPLCGIPCQGSKYSGPIKNKTQLRCGECSRLHLGSRVTAGKQRNWRSLFTRRCSNYKCDYAREAIHQTSSDQIDQKWSIRPQITNQTRLALLSSVFSFLFPLLFICLHLACHPVPPSTPSPLS